MEVEEKRGRLKNYLMKRAEGFPVPPPSTPKTPLQARIDAWCLSVSSKFDNNFRNSMIEFASAISGEGLRVPSKDDDVHKREDLYMRPIFVLVNDNAWSGMAGTVVVCVMTDSMNALNALGTITNNVTLTKSATRKPTGFEIANFVDTLPEDKIDRYFGHIIKA